MITRISSVIRPKGSDLIFDHPYNAEYLRDSCRRLEHGRRADLPVLDVAVSIEVQLDLDSCFCPPRWPLKVMGKHRLALAG
jgi:hypothetical protein